MTAAELKETTFKFLNIQRSDLQHGQKFEENDFFWQIFNQKKSNMIKRIFFNNTKISFAIYIISKII